MAKIMVWKLQSLVVIFDLKGNAQVMMFYQFYGSRSFTSLKFNLLNKVEKITEPYEDFLRELNFDLSKSI